MRDPKRIDRILGKLRELWILDPDQRFTQFLSNLRIIRFCDHDDPCNKLCDTYEVEDSDIERKIGSSPYG